MNSAARGNQAPTRPPARRGPRHVRLVLTIIVLACMAVVAALVVTPPVAVSVAGQDVAVGAVPPGSWRGWSGPGEAELFGEGTVPTVQTFQGPIRPRLVWQRFNRDAAASAFLQSESPDGRRVISTDTSEIGRKLAQGWSRFFLRLVLSAGLLAAVGYLITIAGVGIVRGRRGRPRPTPHSIWPIVSTALLAMALTTAAAAWTIASVRDQLGGIRNLADLTGPALIVPAPSPAGPPRTDVEVAVIGDSTAAGVGNAPLRDPSDEDIACQRSRDAQAQVLQAATGSTVLNLACASATITDGLLSAQSGRRPVTPEPQVGVLKALASLQVVIVSIGANDVGWSDFLMYCYGLARCDDQVSERLNQSRLDTFRLQYAQLLQQLADLPTRPAVLVTGYYDPFGQTFDCPDLQDPRAPAAPPEGYGFAPDDPDEPDAKMALKIEPMRSMLTELNTVLAQGAEAFGFDFVQPSFADHALCDDQPWVQGMSDPHPFHPNAAGGLAIAAAQLPRLISLMPVQDGL